jgi:hypothetical protein
MVKPIPDTWRFTVQNGTKDYPGFVQVDMVDARGKNHGSVSLRDLIGAYDIPFLNALPPDGVYTGAELKRSRRPHPIDRSKRPEVVVHERAVATVNLLLLE